MKEGIIYRSTYFGVVAKNDRPQLVQIVREGVRGHMRLVEQTAVPGVAYTSWKEAEEDMAARNQQIETVEIEGPPRLQLTLDQLRTGS